MVFEDAHNDFIIFLFVLLEEWISSSLDDSLNFGSGLPPFSIYTQYAQKMLHSLKV